MTEERLKEIEEVLGVVVDAEASDEPRAMLKELVDAIRAQRLLLDKGADVLGEMIEANLKGLEADWQGPRDELDKACREIRAKLAPNNPAWSTSPASPSR